MWPSPVFFASGKWVSGIVSSERNCALSFTLCQVYRFDMHARRLLKTLFCHYSTFTGLAYACLYSSPDAANHSRTRRLLRPRQHTHTHTHTHIHTHTHKNTHRPCFGRGLCLSHRRWMRGTVIVVSSCLMCLAHITGRTRRSLRPQHSQALLWPRLMPFPMQRKKSLPSLAAQQSA